MNTSTWRPECGPDVTVDEEGLCTTCGSTATGDGAKSAFTLLNERDEARAEIKRITHYIVQTERHAILLEQENARLRDFINTFRMTELSRWMAVLVYRRWSSPFVRLSSRC